VVQSSNQGTTAAIVYSLQRIVSLAGNPVVAFFPTDHHYAEEDRFVAALRLALRIAATDNETIILLGAHADYPEVEYGWIEPNDRFISPLTNALHHVNRFWEKPSLPVAQALLTGGCLWNTFVMIGRASAFLDILKASVPHLLRSSFLSRGPEIAGSNFEWTAPDNEAVEFAPGDFSQQVLSASTARLAVLMLGDVGWSDLGTPQRVKFALARYGLDLQNATAAQNETADDLAQMAAFCDSQQVGSFRENGKSTESRWLQRY
jgi:mannose-1-phosphate guanylyltransferase